MMDGGLGRVVPTDFVHVQRYRMAAATPERVEDVLPLPHYLRARMDQGREGSCVGWAWTWAMAILNRRYYDAVWLYHESKRIDEWPGESYSGTSVRAGGDVLRRVGHRRIYYGKTSDPALDDGIERNEWAASVDEVRACIGRGLPVVLGVNWYGAFDDPVMVGREHWIGRGELGPVRGGHAICCYGASDRRQAVRLVNSWGTRYPLVWLPYEALGRLLREQGEAAVIVDRVGAALEGGQG